MRARRTDSNLAAIRDGLRAPLFAVVMGPPCAYGSKRGFYNPKLRRVMLVNSNHENLRTWQDAFRKEMAAAIMVHGNQVVPTITGPARICVTIYLARPKSHFTRSGNLNATGRRTPFPTRKPDCDKVARAVADCGSGIWYTDDSQLVDWLIGKLWARSGTPERTEVEVELIENSKMLDGNKEVMR